MQQRQDGAFDIEEARRVLGDVFAPWVQDLHLSIEAIDHEPPAGTPGDWQPGAFCACRSPIGSAATAASSAVRRLWRLPTLPW
jgi:hypothetical protein